MLNKGANVQFFPLDSILQLWSGIAKMLHSSKFIIQRDDNEVELHAHIYMTATLSLGINVRLQTHNPKLLTGNQCLKCVLQIKLLFISEWDYTVCTC